MTKNIPELNYDEISEKFVKNFGLYFVSNWIGESNDVEKTLINSLFNERLEQHLREASKDPQVRSKIEAMIVTRINILQREFSKDKPRTRIMTEDVNSDKLKEDYEELLKGVEEKKNIFKAENKDLKADNAVLKRKKKAHEDIATSERIKYLGTVLISLIVVILFCAVALSIVIVSSNDKVSFQFSFNIAEFIGSILAGIGILFAGASYTYKTLRELENKD
jgi:ABC-type siderophore export system fused ATPase/permease subunit